VVSNGKFVRVVILSLREGGKRLKETWLVVGILPYKLLNGDIAIP
jgi:hypothetical protein